MIFRNTLQHSLDVNYSCGEENYLRLCCLILYCLMFLSSVAYHMENKPIIIIIILVDFEFVFHSHFFEVVSHFF